VVAAPAPALDEGAYSTALAKFARPTDTDTTDLFRALRSEPSLGEMFPKKMAAAMILVAGGLGFYLWNTLTEAEDDYVRLKQEGATYKWAKKLRTEAIERERKNLAEEVEAVRQFAGERIVWSNYLRDLPTRLPPNACLQGIDASYELQMGGDAGGKRKAVRMLSIRAMARFTDRSSAPSEIDSFLQSLRNVDLLKKDFPTVRLAEVKWKKDGLADTASFTILAMPKEKGAAAPKESG